MPLSNLGGIFAITKLRLLMFASLILTWWLAHMMPHYKPMLKAEVSSRIQRAKQNIPNLVVNWHPRNDPRSQYNESKLALLIEPRPLPHLVPLTLHMISVVPPDWLFLFIGSPESVAMVERAYMIQRHRMSGKIDLEVLSYPWTVRQKEDIFRLLTDIRFYDELLPGVEWIFKYESDSILCANSERGLDEWLDWSWAGLGGDQSNRFSGTGGLSIRRVSAVRRILDFQERFNNTESEDAWFMKRFRVLPGELASGTPSGTLIDNNPVMEKPMGYHFQPNGNALDDQVWKDPRTRKQILEYCPELSMIVDMKLERERCPDDNQDGSRGPTGQEKAAHVPYMPGKQPAQTGRNDDDVRPAQLPRVPQTLPQPPPLPAAAIL
ncbi:Fc.00g108910.m01.CDS01 [Cosmosporella sp. VM-42]